MVQHSNVRLRNFFKPVVHTTSQRFNLNPIWFIQWKRVFLGYGNGRVVTIANANVFEKTHKANTEISEKWLINQTVCGLEAFWFQIGQFDRQSSLVWTCNHKSLFRHSLSTNLRTLKNFFYTQEKRIFGNFVNMTKPWLYQ